MTRLYRPHPGKLPTQTQSERRWLKPGVSAGTVIGELPYEKYVERARVGEAPFYQPVNPFPNDTQESLASRLMGSADIGKMAANTVALGLLGKDHLREGRKTVFTAEVLAHRDSARFRSDPTPLRGNLEACVTPADFHRIYPALAVNLSALRSLKWSPGVRPKDLLLLWILIACASASRTVPSTGVLRRGFGISRPQDALRRIRQTTYTLDEDPAVPADRWVKAVDVFVDGRISKQLIEHVKPRAGGENYAYLELFTLSKLSAAWQEMALRGIMAASVRARVFWSKGGTFDWELSLPEAMKLFSLTGCDINRLRKERAAPLVAILDGIRQEAWQIVRRDLRAAIENGVSAGTRFAFNYRTMRKADVQGRPASAIVLQVKVFAAHTEEKPTGQYAVDRSKQREKHQPKDNVLISGLGKSLSDEERREKRSEAAKRGWEKRNLRPIPSHHSQEQPPANRWRTEVEQLDAELRRIFDELETLDAAAPQSEDEQPIE